MKKIILYWVLMGVFALLLASPQVMAEEKGKKGVASAPSGWEKGKKEGWQGDAPPAHEKEAVEAVSEEAAPEEAAEEAEEEKKGSQNESENEKK